MQNEPRSDGVLVQCNGPRLECDVVANNDAMQGIGDEIASAASSQVTAWLLRC